MHPIPSTSLLLLHSNRSVQGLGQYVGSGPHSEAAAAQYHLLVIHMDGSSVNEISDFNIKISH